MKTLLVLSFFSVAAQAGQRCHETSQPQTPTNWNHAFVLPKHSPELGPLESVTVTLRSMTNFGLALENLDAAPGTAFFQLGCVVSARRPGASVIVSTTSNQSVQADLAPFDGTIDFDGPSGETFTNLHQTRESSIVLQSLADLALFTAMSNGETISLGVDAQSSASGGGPGNIVVSFSTSARFELMVCYGYREVCQTDATPPTTTNWQTTRTFAKHDPAVGPLRAVRLRAQSALSGSLSVENPSAAPVDITSRLSVRTTIHRPDTSEALGFETAQGFRDMLAVYDGTLDFDGPSGVTHSGVTTQSSGHVTLTSPADLALFTASSPGEAITLEFRGTGVSTTVGGGPLLTLFIISSAIQVVEVCYDFSAHVVPFCFGDGTGAPCPCGNASPAGAQQGCLNSLGLGGELRGNGVAEIGADTLLFTASNLPATAPALFFQGSNAISVPFGDGLRCTSAMVQRLGTTSAASGVAAFPPAGTSISALGNATVGTTLHYQVWYRNVVAFCTPSGFNLTNGLRITW